MTRRKDKFPDPLEDIWNKVSVTELLKKVRPDIFIGMRATLKGGKVVKDAEWFIVGSQQVSGRASYRIHEDFEGMTDGTKVLKIAQRVWDELDDVEDAWGNAGRESERYPDPEWSLFVHWLYSQMDIGDLPIDVEGDPPEVVCDDDVRILVNEAAIIFMGLNADVQYMRAPKPGEEIPSA